MKSLSLVVGFGLGVAHLGNALPHSSFYPRAGNGTACAAGVHMIIARASTEAPGPGIIGGVATMVMNMVAGSDMVAVDYPATLTNYASSEASGVAGMQKLIQAYTTQCPNSKYALLGYSQGAQVVGDVLGGTSEAGQAPTDPLPASMAKNLVAVVQMGDPSHVPGQPQDVGTSTKPGVFPRQNTAALSPYAGLIQSYCDSSDEFCDSGTSLAVHLSYVQNFGTQAAKFIQGKVTNQTAIHTATNAASPIVSGSAVLGVFLLIWSLMVTL